MKSVYNSVSLWERVNQQDNGTPSIVDHYNGSACVRTAAGIFVIYIGTDTVDGNYAFGANCDDHPGLGFMGQACGQDYPGTATGGVFYIGQRNYSESTDDISGTTTARGMNCYAFGSATN